ncbi:sulfite exporter TauE/SafE family protein [uncultured Modestobacter sp.]|uniref:sulfite exporter TauE/SafE family protein n=1 Tax=uncultured Modestobacter sp. TaxID=380048 RepID=UPI002631A277|nr:sulfite exporter TauE/SafE family protein [uncultured Modestobacter sp.]
MITAAAAGLGLLIGLSLGALGGGGSVLTVPALVYVIGQDAQAATASSLFIVGIAAAAGALGHPRSGHVRWGIGLAFGVVGIAASLAGTAGNRLVDPNVLLLSFAVVVLIAAAGMLAQIRRSTDDSAAERRLVHSGGTAAGTSPAPRREPPRATSDSGVGGTDRRLTAARAGKVVAAGLLVGFMTGFFGVGGGFVVVPALVLALRMPMQQAVATSLLVIALNSTSSLLARAGSAHFDWSVIVPFTLAAVAGSLAGKKVADRFSGMALTRAFAVLLIAVAVYTATSSIIGLAS